VAAFGGKKEIMSIIGMAWRKVERIPTISPGFAAAYATLSLLKSKPILKTLKSADKDSWDWFEGNL